jgi:hypothetical protein
MSDSYIQAMPFIVLRNGDLIFEDQYRNAYSASTQNYFWYYDHTTATVTPRTLSGTGYVGNAGENIALCNAYRLAANYNPVTGTITNYIGTLSQSGSACTSATDAVRLNASYTSTTPIPPTFPGGGNSSYFNLITGLDGKIYGLHGIYGTIYRFDSSANTWTALAGSGSLGSCIDGTSALSCSLTPTNVAVNKQGQVYFVDGGKVRMLYSDGTIRTVYGYGAATGDGGPGLLAQFGVLSDLGFWYNGSRKVVLYDKSNSNLREVNLAADNVTKIAGNGTTAPANSGSPALTTGLGIINWEKTFAINPSTGDVFWKNSSGGGQLVRLDRGTGNWVSVVGGGATDYFTSADDFAGSAVYFNYGYYQPIFYANGFLWAHVSNSAHQNVAVKAYDSTMSYTQSNYLSLSGSYSSSCPSVQTSCGTMFPANGSLRVSYDSLSASLLFAINGSNTIKYGNAGNILTFTITNNPISAFAYRNNGNDFIYYCSSSGALFKRDVTGSSEVPISLPTNVKCASTKMEVDSGSNVLYFVSEKNGIYGLASVPL